MLTTIAIAALSFALARTAWVLHRTKTELSITSDKLIEAAAEYDEVCTYLANLRRNAFLTNEKGHRVRYTDASQDVRARAESN